MTERKVEKARASEKKREKLKKRKARLSKLERQLLKLYVTRELQNQNMAYIAWNLEQTRAKRVRDYVT